MTDVKKRELEAEMAYKEALLKIETDEVKRYYDEITDYLNEYFEKDFESYRNRQNLYYKAQEFKLHVDNSRARMEEIEDIKVELGIKRDEL